jgi:integral membrane protein
MVAELLKTTIGKLRIITFLEGVSLLILMFVCMPLKYIFHLPIYTKVTGYIHGGLFIIFLVYVWQAAEEYNWKFKDTTWKVIFSSFIPFGTFYVDKTILSKV